MNDLISRQTAINGIAEYYKNKQYIARHRKILSAICLDLKSVIDTLPSVEAEPVRHGRWIPVSEQLPEDGQEVLFSTKTGRVHLGRYHNDNSVNQWYSSLDKMRAWNNVVNAWMPLPEPYEERYED